MKKILLILAVVIVAVVALPLAALGFIPGLSQLVGASPKDLGVAVSDQEADTARSKALTQIVALPASTPLTEDYVLEGKQEANFTMDSKELTGLAHNRPMKNFPVKDLQIRINQDGSIESSGVLIVEKVMPFAVALGYSETDIRKAMQQYNVPPFEIPFYLKGTGSVANDQVSVNAQSLKIGAISIPSNIVSQASAQAESVLEDLIQKNSAAFHAESVTFADGKMSFVGHVPVKEYVVQ